jgi:hypothetical protein
MFISLASIIIFASLIIILHFLRPDLDPPQRPTSEYAVGNYDYLMTVAFLYEHGIICTGNVFE